MTFKQKLKYQIKPILFGALLVAIVHGFSNGWWGLGFIIGVFLMITLVFINLLLLMSRFKKNKISIIITLVSFIVCVLLLYNSDFF
jgi:hypothetical protein